MCNTQNSLLLNQHNGDDAPQNYMYMFRPIAAIIRFSFESMVVALLGLVWLYHDGEISTSVMFAIVKGHSVAIVHFRCPQLVGFCYDDGRNRPKHVHVVISILY